MKRRYVNASIGFIIGLGVALLLGSILQADSGNTYQIFRGGQPGETFTTSSSPMIAAFIILIFSGIGLLIGYRYGTNADASSLEGKGSVLSWRRDLGLIALLALLSRIVLLNGAIDMNQLVLVAIAVAFGPGIGLLSGISGQVIGIIIATIILSISSSYGSGLYGGGWHLLIIAALSGLEGVVIGWLAKRSRPAWFLAAIIVAATVGFLQLFLQAILLFGKVSVSLSMGLIIRTLLLSTTSGLFIGLLLRKARPSGTPVVKVEDIKPSEKTPWRR